VVARLVVYVAARKQRLQEHRRAAELQAQERQRAAELQEQERRRDEESRKLAERGRVDFLAQRLRALNEMQELACFLTSVDASAAHAKLGRRPISVLFSGRSSASSACNRGCSVQASETLLANSPLFGILSAEEEEPTRA
jgi:hypothetical protein